MDSSRFGMTGVQIWSVTVPHPSPPDNLLGLWYVGSWRKYHVRVLGCAYTPQFRIMHKTHPESIKHHCQTPREYSTRAFDCLPKLLRVASYLIYTLSFFFTSLTLIFSLYTLPSICSDHAVSHPVARPSHSSSPQCPHQPSSARHHDTQRPDPHPGPRPHRCAPTTHAPRRLVPVHRARHHRRRPPAIAAVRNGRRNGHPQHHAVPDKLRHRSEYDHQ